MTTLMFLDEFFGLGLGLRILDILFCLAMFCFVLFSEMFCLILFCFVLFA